MATLPNIVFLKGQGGLGRPLPGQDHVSGMVFYTGSLPSGFTSSARSKVLYAPSDAEAAGIYADYRDATAAAGSWTNTVVGADGNTVTLTVNQLKADGTVEALVLCTYTKVSADTTVSLVATAVAALINAGTLTHGYSAVPTVGAVAITAPKKFGIYLNTGTNLVATYSSGATLAGTLVQFTGGTASAFARYRYHINEFFRMQPKGVLWVGFYAVPSPYVFTEITSLQSDATGAIRQVGVYKDGAAFATADIQAIQVVCAANDVLYKPLSAVYAGDLVAASDISALVTLNTLASPKVSAVIGQDGAGLGNFLYQTTGKSIGTLGLTLGTIALAKVSEDIAWVASFNTSNGTETEVLAFANGQKFTAAAITDSLLEALNVKRYIFLKKFIGLSGSYHNDSHTAVIQTSDYAYIENNRVIDKAIRGVYTYLLPSLAGPITLNTNGTISETAAAYLEAQAEAPLEAMVRDGELSGFDVTINPEQNVLTTSKIIVPIKLLINGVARYIEVPIGFVTAL